MPRVLDGDGRERALRLAEEDQRDIVAGRVAGLPHLVEGHEQVGIARTSTMTLEVLELPALPGDVIDHHVEQHVMAASDVFDVRPCPEPRIELLVRQRREPAITGRRERRQDVHTPEQSVQRPIEEGAKSAKVAAQRVRVGQQLRARRDASVLHRAAFGLESGAASVGSGNDRQPCDDQREPRRHPFTDPCSSAVMMCRWNRRNSTSVGRRIRMVPAHRSGMSVA